MRVIVFQITILVLAFAALATATHAAPGAKLPDPPCQDTESAPPPRGPQAELRDGTLAFGSPSASYVAAAACIVLGATEQKPLAGKSFNYNFAMFAPGSRLLDVNGTLRASAPFASPPLPASVTALPLPFPMPPPGARIDKHLLLGQVNIADCNDKDCKEPNVSDGYYITAVLHPAVSSPPAAPLRSDKSEPGCLDPVDPKRDPDLRQVIVAGVGMYYAVYACLVSSIYSDFQSAGFQVERLRAKKSGNMLDGQGGNTREHVHALVNGPASGPRVLTLFGVDIPAKKGEAVPVISAHITTTYIGCSDDNEPKCDSRVTKTHHYHVRYYTRPH